MQNILVFNRLCCYIRVEIISSTRPLGRVFVFLGYDPSADGRWVVGAQGIGRWGDGQGGLRQFRSFNSRLLTQQAKSALAGDPDSAARSGWQVEARRISTPRANSGLRRDPGFAPRSFVWVWDWVWVALGWPKRGPRATQASRKDRMEEMLCLQQSAEKGRAGGVGGVGRSPTSP
jgi:hypothetical protein